ncbi:hypothetical protein NOVO_01705 [Rickettsiales bacterium Ac37b]|nr:hypothetical protein NOVO_01705 [Rickettsiales bacterium Ac37b]
MKKTKVKYSKPPVAARYSDYGTKELQEKGEVEYIDIEGGYKQARVTNQTPVERLYKRSQIEAYQFHAVQILQRDYFKANTVVSVKAKVVIDPITQKSNYQPSMLGYCFLDSRERYEQAMAKVRKFEEQERSLGNNAPYSAIVQYMVLDDGYLKDLKQVNPDYVNIGVYELKKALDVLAKYYNIFPK